MPIWLRNFTFSRLADWAERQNEQQQQTTQKKDIPKGPDIQPSYTTKASTK